MAKATWDWEGRIGRRVKLRDIHVLSEVVRSGSMAKAASHLAMSQSAVSEAIASLEDALRVKLLDRSSQGIEPTIYADVLLKRGNVVFDELSQAIKDIEFLAKPTAGEVRVASQEFFTAGLSAGGHRPAFGALPADRGADHRNEHGSSRNIGNCRSATPIWRCYRVTAAYKNDEVNIEILFDDPQFIVAGARSRWARRRNVTLADLASEPWILPPSLAVQSMHRDRRSKRSA